MFLESLPYLGGGKMPYNVLFSLSLSFVSFHPLLFNL